VFEHLATVDLEALAELNVGFVDRLLQQCLARDQRQGTEIVAILPEQLLIRRLLSIEMAGSSEVASRTTWTSSVSLRPAGS
jgi:hypothetical protein